MANSASTPEFKKILNDLYGSGRYRKSGQVLKEAWRVYKSRHGSIRKIKSHRNPRKLKVHRTCKTCGGLMRGSVCLNCLKKNPRRRMKRNPIAVYNPPTGKLLPMVLIEIRYRRTGGEYSRKFFKHKFSGANSNRVYGLADGSLLIKANKRLWGTAE